MSQISKLNPVTKNPHLKSFEILIGEWKTVGRHRLLPDKTLHGQTSFSWLEGGAYLKYESKTDEPEIPDAISIIGSDDAANKLSMLYYDTRGVSRNFEVKFNDNVLEIERIFPGFSQRFKGIVKNNGNTIEGVWELCEDEINWKPDLEITYTKIH